MTQVPHSISVGDTAPGRQHARHAGGTTMLMGASILKLRAWTEPSTITGPRTARRPLATIPPENARVSPGRPRTTSRGDDEQPADLGGRRPSMTTSSAGGRRRHRPPASSSAVAGKISSDAGAHRSAPPRQRRLGLRGQQELGGDPAQPLVRHRHPGVPVGVIRKLAQGGGGVVDLDTAGEDARAAVDPGGREQISSNAVYWNAGGREGTGARDEADVLPPSGDRPRRCRFP